MSWLAVFGSDTTGLQYSLDYLADEVLPWIIGCSTGFMYFVRVRQYLFQRKGPTFELSRWLPSNQIYYIAAAFDVLSSYASLLRINFSFLRLAIFPLAAVSFIGALYLRYSQLIGHHTDNGKKKKKKKKKHGKKTIVMPENFTIVDSGQENNFNIVALLAHSILCVFGLVGDPDHDGNSYDISSFFLFLTCMLQNLTIMMTKLPSTISRGITPASEVLYKSSLVLLLLTAHMVAVNAFGRKVLLVLLPELVPPLLWFSFHLDRRTSVININIQKIKDGEHIFFRTLAVAICSYMVVVVPQDQLFFYWAGWSCLASAVMTHIIVLLLHLWPEKTEKLAGKRGYDTHNTIGTLSFKEVLDLLTFWGKFLLKVAAGLFALRAVAWLKSAFGP